MGKNSLFLLFSLLTLITLSSSASHILGGELRMEALGLPNQYSISMIQFWDKEKLTFANQDPRAEMLFYRKRDNSLVYKTTIPLVSTNKVNYQNDVCAQFRSLDSQVGTYSATVTLNPADFSDPGGYYVVWERCCRNAAISNIRSPGESGLVFYLEFPPVSVRNSSPVFNRPNGDYICKDVAYTTNVGATDADGDELRYSLVTPFRGNTTLMDPDGTDSPKAGYPEVDWSGSSSAQNSIPGNPALRIDARTGELTVTASQLGLFVYTVLCEEYRNGQRIGAVRRDYQSLVIECNPPPPSPIIVHEGQPTKAVEFCENKSSVLEVQQPGDWLYQWNRGGQPIPGATSAQFEVRDEGIYTVTKSPKDKQCTGISFSESVTVNIRKPPIATIDQAKPAICDGQSLELKASKSESYIYEWRRNSDILAESGPDLLVDQVGNYTLMVRDKASGCTANTSTEVKMESISVDLPSQISLLRGESTVLRPVVNSSVAIVRYEWSPPAGLSSPTAAQPTASPNSSMSYTLKVTSSGGCDAIDSVRVLVIDCSSPPEPIIEFNGSYKKTIEFCPERSVLLQIQQPGDWAYQWQLNGTDIVGGSNDNLAATKLGNYTVIRKFKTGSPCPMTTPSQTVNLIAGTPPTIDISGAEKLLCSGGQISLSTKADSSFSYEWKSGNNVVVGKEAKIFVRQEGNYSLLVTNINNGCSSRASATVILDTTRVPSPVVIHNGSPAQTIEFCSGGFAELKVQSPGTWAYQWYLDEKEIQGALASTFSARETGIYTLIRSFKEEGQCGRPASSQSVTLSVGKKPLATITKNSEVLCAEEQVELKVEEIDNYSYEWSFDSRSIGENRSKILVKQAGLYRLTVTNTANGCSATDSIRIDKETITVELPEKLIVRRGESTTLDPVITSSTQSLVYSWTPPSGLDSPGELKPVASPTGNTSYVLQASTPGGCTASDTVNVIIIDRIYVPDAFSPNGDGINDLMVIQNGEQLIETIRIYDRWGTIVFFENNYENPWDGTFKNVIVPTGIYTYLIKTSFENLKGSILIIY